MNRPPYGDVFRRNSQFYKMFEVTAQTLPNKTVRVSAGSYTKNGTEVVEYVGANTPDISAPTTGAKWVLITLNQNNGLTVVDGTPSTNSPPVPILTETSLPLALIYYKSNDTVVTQDMIYDVRPFFGIYFETVPKLSVADFNTTLNNTVLTLNNVLDTKADMDGTNSSEFTINREETGALSSDAFISINRGQETKVSIRWNEELNKWQYTNDGIIYVDFGSSWETALASASTIGNVKLSVAPANVLEPIVVGNNDLRLFVNEAEKTSVLTAVNTTVPSIISSISLLQAEDSSIRSALSTLNTTVSDHITNTAAFTVTQVSFDTLNTIVSTLSSDFLTHVSNTSSFTVTQASFDALDTSVNNLIANVATISADYVTTTDSRLFASATEKQSVLDYIANSSSTLINYSDLSPALASKLATVDESETITSIWTFSPTVSHAPFIIGLNSIGKLVTGLNAEFVGGKTPSDFVSSIDATDHIIFTDLEVPTNKYKLGVRSGMLVIDLII